MRTSQRIGQTNARLFRHGAVTVVLAALALATSAGTAIAHGGDTTKIHSCIVPSSGYAQIVGPSDTCSKNHRAQDWSAFDTNTTYSAGSGLSLSGNVFSVTGAPWSGLTGVPAGFADGVDDIGSTRWSDLTGIPADLLDGDDDGSAGLSELLRRLASDDGTPNESDDLVSFSKIKDLESAAGGRILSSFIQNGTIQDQDVAAGAITSAKLAGEYTQTYPEVIETTPGAVTGEKIKDGTIAGRDLGNVVTVATQAVDPVPVAAGTRAAVTFTVAGVRANDLVTVSPPADLEQDLFFAGSDVLRDGEVTVYLHNATAAAVDGSMRTWKVRWLNTDG